MENLKVAREKAGYTQEQFAERLGVSRIAVARYENGSRWPSKDMLLEMANILGCSIDYLLGRSIDLEIKKEAPPAMAEGEAEVSFSFPNGDEAAFDAGFDAAVREIVRQELSRRGIE